MSQEVPPSPPRHSPPPMAPEPPAAPDVAEQNPAAAPPPPAEPPAEADPAELERRAHEAAREVRPRPRPPPKAAPPAQYEDIDLKDYTARKDVYLPLDDIKFDREVDMGQLRGLDDVEVAKLREQMLLNQPTECANIVVWEAAPGGPFYVIAGQHETKALQSIRRDKITQEALPQYLTHVKATIIRTDAPLHVRRLIASKHQAQQQRVSKVRTSRCAEILLLVHEDERFKDKTTLEKICEMISLSGQHRSPKLVCTSLNARPAFHCLTLFMPASIGHVALSQSKRKCCPLSISHYFFLFARR